MPILWTPPQDFGSHLTCYICTFRILRCEIYDDQERFNLWSVSVKYNFTWNVSMLILNPNTQNIKTQYQNKNCNLSLDLLHFIRAFLFYLLLRVTFHILLSFFDGQFVRVFVFHVVGLSSVSGHHIVEALTFTTLRS